MVHNFVPFLVSGLTTIVSDGIVSTSLPSSLCDIEPVSSTSSSNKTSHCVFGTSCSVTFEIKNVLVSDTQCTVAEGASKHAN